MAYDWLLIKREYVQGYEQDGELVCPTLEQLCTRHGCSFSTIRKKSSTEKWLQERNIFRTKKEQKITEKRLNNLVEEATNIDNKALTIADKGLSLVEKRLEAEDVSNHDALKLSNTAANFHRMGKLALGEPTEHHHTTGKTSVELNIHDRIQQTSEYFKQLDES